MDGRPEGWMLHGTGGYWSSRTDRRTDMGIKSAPARCSCTSKLTDAAIDALAALAFVGCFPL